MKKVFFFILILAGIVFFASADYLLNIKEVPKIPTKVNNGSDQKLPDVDVPNLTEKLTSTALISDKFNIIKRSRVNQIFEKIDTSEFENLIVFQNYLEDNSNAPLFIYEIHGPEAQGSLTYLGIKMKFIDKISATFNINESNEYGQNSFYINDKNSDSTAFMMVQIGDDLFGFQYKKDSSEVFEVIKNMIKNYNLQDILN